VLGSVRHSETLARPARDVWEYIGDPAAIATWFPDFESSSVEGSTRTITTTSGLTFTEELLIVDPILRRIQYTVNLPLASFHRGTLDVIEVDADSCVVSYATEADPRMMALVIGAPTYRALKALVAHFEEE
jgi:Polyketide cyclase / dehydrase and lipid transport